SGKYLSVKYRVKCPLKVNSRLRQRLYVNYLLCFFQLFLDDTKVKNFITCFKDKQFLVFFFKQLRRNVTSRYPEFPYVSLCGRERNFVRCDDLPIVFTHLLASEPELLSYCGGGEHLAIPFQPQKLYMPENGRLYHPAPPRSGPVGLVKSSLAFELSPHFEYEGGGPESGPPTYFHWKGQRYHLTNELAQYIPAVTEKEPLG
uniref:Chromosome 8 open reading frame 82 n=1 Tax=Callorhinchus milii TaxID=7868 RepID=A0A4W3GLV2_CALMI